jgi:hypothetical protein
MAKKQTPKASKKLIEKILYRAVTASDEEIFANIGKFAPKKK